jgi:hypothetical protein
MTHIIGAEHFAIGRVLQQEPLESEQLTESLLCERGEYFGLEVINIVIPDYVLED